jgi:hypothetical protein
MSREHTPRARGNQGMNCFKSESGPSLKPRVEVNVPDSYHYSPAVFNNNSPLRMAAVFRVGQVCQATNQGCTHERMLSNSRRGYFEVYINTDHI